MIVLLGRSCSGKTTLLKDFERQGYKKIVTYTTRPPRDNEKDGIDYHFISNQQFSDMVKKGEFAETSVYRGWYYGSAIKDYVSQDSNEKKVVILTPKGLRMIKNNCKMQNQKNIYSCFINVSPKNCLVKSIETRTDIDECYRRYVSDNGMFYGIEEEVDFVIDNGAYERNPIELVNIILQKIRFKQEKELGDIV